MDNIEFPVSRTRRSSQAGLCNTLAEAARWASALDWRNSDCELCRVLDSVAAHLDAAYREFGMRLDQLISRNEFVATAKRAAEWYRHAEPQYHVVGIYEYLYREINHMLRQRAIRVIEARRRSAEPAV